MEYLFENCLLDVRRRELRRDGAVVAMEPQVFDLLTYLIRSRDRVVSKDDLIDNVWSGRIVSESTLTSRMHAARKAIGDTGEEQRLIRTVARKGFRFVGEVEEADRSAPPPAADRAPAGEPRQQIRFCAAADGARIAWAESGHGPPLVKASNWLNHLERDWDGPILGPLFHALASRHRLIRYDERGNGLSDWSADDISFDAFVRDLEAAVDAAGVERFALMGLSQGCAVAVAYAARHPERVSRLILSGGYARGRRRRGRQDEIDRADALETLVRQGWEQENPAFRQIFTSQLMPDGSTEQMRWLNELQRMTVSAENAVRIRRAMDEIDVTDLLPRVKTPTLVLHCRDDAVQPLEEGRLLAVGIPGARFVTLESRSHIVLETDPAWPRFIDEIVTFARG